MTDQALPTRRNYERAIQFHRAGKLREAAAAYQQILQLDPDHADALHMLGLLFYQMGSNPKALELLSRAIRLNPDDANYYVDFALAQAVAGLWDASIASCRRALAIRPNDAAAFNNLGNALQKKGLTDEAVAAFRSSIAARPDIAETHSNLGNALRERGEHDEALTYFRKATSLSPAPRFASGYLFCLHYMADYGPRQILEEHQRWNQMHARPLRGALEKPSNDTSPNRRLRVGYVSSDLRDHPISRFLLPLLRHRNRESFEVFCYSAVRSPDRITGQIRQETDQWREIAPLSYLELARTIRKDAIDILVDLSMHTSERLLAFAYKPAPVQATYLAYCSTTGLETMDYRLSDPYLDPPGTDQDYSEQTIRLPHTYWCYEPPPEAPPVGPLPALANGFVTFGCFNNYSKVTAAILKIWASLLREVPNSRLLLHSPQGSHRERALETLAAAGVKADRIEFVSRVPLVEYLMRHNQIDIGLDPFPWTGGTTTCDALWMGVPIVTLAGATAVSRGGASLLSNAGLPELIAHSPEQYVQIASELAADLSRLQSIRSSLRAKLANSPLTHAPQFARDVESAYRQMWLKWCDERRK